MATASVTIKLELPEGVEIREYQRHGDGHAFHAVWPLPDRGRCDGCASRQPSGPFIAAERLTSALTTGCQRL